MSDLSFGKLVVPTLMATGAVFTALSAPVVMFADTPISLTQGKSQVLYQGDVRNAALPYLMLAGATSIGLGVSGVAMAGWRKSSKQAEALEDSLQTEEERRAERQAHLEAALASDSYMEKSGLGFFLEDGEVPPFEPENLPVARPEVTAVAPVQQSVIAEPVSVAPKPQPALAQQAIATMQPPIEEMDLAAQLAWLDEEDVAPAQQPVRHVAQSVARPATPAAPPIMKSSVPVAKPPVPVQQRPQPVAQAPAQRPAVRRPATVAKPQSASVQRPSPQAAMTAAQGFYGLNRGTAQHPASAHAMPGFGSQQDHLTIERIQSLQSQLQEIVTQIESLQANLPAAEEPIQIVEELPANQSGLVQSGFEMVTEHQPDKHIQRIRRFAS